MTKQSYFPMPNQVALDCIKSFIQPNNPTLGIWLGWNQPNDEDYIKFGSCYTLPSFDDYHMTLHDLLQDTALGYNSAKQIVDEFRIHYHNKRGYQYERLELSGIWETEVFRQFAELDNNQKCIFRLCIMVINTMTELHNFACAYMEELAEEYCKDSDDWSLYDSSDTWLDSIISDNIAEFKSKISFSSYFQYNQTDETYSYLNDEFQIAEWMNEIESQFQYGDNIDLIEYTFGIDVHLKWEREEVLKVLSECIEWIQSEWLEDNLTLTLHDSMPDSVKQFVTQFNNQDLLPGFESL